MTAPSLPPLLGGAPGRPAGVAPAHHLGATLRRLWRYLGARRGGLVLAMLLTVGGTGLTLLGPWWIGRIIDRHVVAAQLDGLGGACLGLLAVLVGGVLMSWAQSWLLIGLSQQTVAQLRQHLFAHLQTLPLRFFQRRSQGDLMSRATQDIELLAQCLNQALPQLMGSVVLLIGALALMLSMDVGMTVLALLTVPLVALVTRQVARHTRRHFAAQQRLLGELNGFVEEQLSAQKVVRAYRQENRAIAHFGALNAQARAAAERAQILSGTMGPAMNAMNNLGLTLLAAIGAWLALRGQTSVGVVVAFLHYARQIERPINDFANQFNLAQAAVAGAERVFDLLDETGEYPPQENGRLERVRGDVRFHGVRFGYDPAQPVLQDIELQVRAGERVALVGATGAGKSSLAHLLLRFHDPDHGRITLDGHDLRGLDKRGLRRHFGMVLQDTHLLQASVRDNLRFGRPEAGDDEVEAAARQACADAFIRALPQGYDTVLRDNGADLSQGQRQLLAIARVLLANPGVLILDEATSQVDTRTEAALQRALARLQRGRTCFVIAHRLSTVEGADRIVVLDHGRIVEQGRHAELLARRGAYHALYRSQFETTTPAAGTAADANGFARAAAAASAGATG